MCDKERRVRERAEKTKSWCGVRKCCCSLEGTTLASRLLHEPTAQGVRLLQSPTVAVELLQSPTAAVGLLQSPTAAVELLQSSRTVAVGLLQ